VKSYNLLYGPALVEAYRLENRSAVFPRIVVDPHILEEVRVNKFIRHPDHDGTMELEHINDLLKQDQNGILFVDYLRTIKEECRETADYLNFLHVHRGLILNGLARYRMEDKIYQKYLWLKEYHKNTVKQFSPPVVFGKYIV